MTPHPCSPFGGQSWCPLPGADFLVHENNSSFLGNSLTQIYTDIILSSRTVSLDEMLHRNQFCKSGQGEKAALAAMVVEK